MKSDLVLGMAFQAFIAAHLSAMGWINLTWKQQAVAGVFFTGVFIVLKIRDHRASKSQLSEIES